MKSQQHKARVHFQPLTCIRQLGLHHHLDGAVTYTFLAQASRDLPPVMITLMATGRGEMQVQARFVDTMSATFTAGEEGQLRCQRETPEGRNV